MPVQTTKQGYIGFPDGGKVSVDDGTGWHDIGAINSAVTFALNYSENQVATANSGKLAKQISDMLIDGALTLINLEPEAIDKLGGGMFEVVNTAAATVIGANITDQVIAGFEEKKPIEIKAIVTATGEPIRFSAAPVITGVEASESGEMDATDYFIISDSTSASGYSIVISTTGSASVAESETVTIDFGDNDPLAGTTIYAGTSTQVLNAFGLKIEHTDDTAAIDRSFEIYSANPTSGGFQFNFKGANEDGVEEMPITFQGNVNLERADGRQLFSYYIKG